MSAPTINVAAFFPLVAPHAYGASEPIMSQAIRLSAIEFCERTRCWRHASTYDILASGEATAIAPGYAAIHEFEVATFDDEIELEPIAYTDVEPGGFDLTGPPKYITQVSPNEIIILPAGAGSLDLSVFLKPRHGQEYELQADGDVENLYDAVPEFLLTMYGERIAAGALWRLLTQENTPYYSPQRGALFKAKFDEAAEASFGSNIRGQQRARIRSAAYWF